MTTAAQAAAALRGRTVASSEVNRPRQAVGDARQLRGALGQFFNGAELLGRGSGDGGGLLR
jgi:hypothetical protein